MNRLISTALAAALGLAVLPAQAVPEGNAEAGAELARTCAACHGEAGRSQNPQFPKLAGQYASYIVAALQGYKSGRRENAIMNGIAAPLSLEEMEDLGAYFSQQESQLYTPSR